MDGIAVAGQSRTAAFPFTRFLATGVKGGSGPAFLEGQEAVQSPGTSQAPEGAEGRCSEPALTRGTVLLAGAVAVALKNSSVCGLTTVECVITPPAMTKEVLLNLCAAPLALPGCLQSSGFASRVQHIPAI